ncbi:hypothetical protein EGW08_016104 [Elysia chlorotica]|uniref:THAP-type domain-containing protein n=1 Tax=Elysia chlorotica TaxID=188477 RepID=A0A433T3L2_ELYCH|nr:hypothetical protein EGW08_016104 [Elysia chlorotica]
MVADCCIFNCSNRRSVITKNQKELVYEDESQPESKTKYHKFPIKNLERLEQWVRVCLPYVRDFRSWRVGKDTKICWEHFVGSNYNPETGWLRKDATPSVFFVEKVSDDPECTSEDSNLWMRVVEKCFSFPGGTIPGQDSPSPSPRIRKFRHARHRCSALGCTSAPPSTDAFGRPIDDSDISFHKIPYDLPTFKKWVKAIGRTDIEPSPKWNLCSRHFTPDCFELFEKRLKPSSIPTLFWPPPPELLHCVDPKAPYLQPRIVLRRVDEPECEPRSDPRLVDSAKPNVGLDTEEEPMDVADVLPETVTVDLDMDATRHDHGYIKLETVDPEEEVARLRMLLEQLKEKVMSSSQRVKSLKISVSALKYQFELERDSLGDSSQVS